MTLISRPSTTLQAVKKMHNEQVSDAMSKEDKNMWFLNLEKQTVLRHMMRETKVTTMPLATSVNAPNFPLGQTNSNKAKLEKARQSSLAMCNVGKLPLAPAPMASNVTYWVTFGPTMTAPNPPITVTTPAPMVAMTTPAAMWVWWWHLLQCMQRLVLLNLTRGDNGPLATMENFRIVNSDQSGIMLSWAVCVSTSASKSWI